MHEPPTILCGRIIKNWDFSTKIFFCVQHDDNALQRASVKVDSIKHFFNLFRSLKLVKTLHDVKMRPFMTEAHSQHVNGMTPFNL